jgi:hypothetical protein
MTAPTRYIGILALSTVLAMPAMVLAQEAPPPIPVAEISGGYMLMRDTEAEETFPGGWFFSGAANLNRWFAVVGEAAASYKKERDQLLDVSYSGRLQLYTFMGGPRFFRQFGRIVPFAQVLAGAAHARAKSAVSGPPFGNLTSKVSDTAWALQPGGGGTMYISERVGARVAADYRLIADHEDDEWETTNEFRVIAGLTFGWGQR